MAKVAPTYKESDNASEAMFGETDDEKEDIAESAPRREGDEADTFTGTAGSEEE